MRLFDNVKPLPYHLNIYEKSPIRTKIMQTQKKKKLSLPEVFPMQAKNLVKNQNNPIITDAVKFIILVLGGSARL